VTFDSGPDQPLEIYLGLSSKRKGYVEIMWWRSHSRDIAVFEPRSMVEVLRSEQDLGDALHRAAIFERGVARVINERVAHYEALLAPDSPRQPAVIRLVDPQGSTTRREQQASSLEHMLDSREAAVHGY